MNNSIKKIRFSKLWKLELPELATSVIKIVERHNPETLKIKVFFDLLVELEPQIKLLVVQYGAHPITKKVNVLRKRRRALAQGITNRLNTFEKGGDDSAIEHLEVAQPAAYRYLHGLSRCNVVVTSQKVTQFLEHFQDDVKLQGAIEALNMTSYIDDLQSVHNTLGAYYSGRRASVSDRPKVKTQTITTLILTAMDNMFKNIELAQVENKELDYTHLIDELNRELTFYGSIINGRASYNKKKAEEALNNDEVVEDNEVVVEDPSEEPSQSTPRMVPLNVGEDNEENSDNLDVKKTVAASTKQIRLSNNPTEA